MSFKRIKLSSSASGGFVINEEDRLSSLPLEIQQLIFLEIDFLCDLIALSSTSAYFRSAISPLSHIPHGAKAAAVIRAEAADTEGRLACFRCFTLHSVNFYSKKQRTKHRSKGHSEGHKRFCVHCGMKAGLYTPDNLLFIPNCSLLKVGRDGSLRDVLNPDIVRIHRSKFI
ncbi:hypothetical protein CYLTODRAFT_457697 [Cylindrobasidium torrendii FP15055 ss-10]|uniref:F-box domain-containing protein n=1 Tax=Cylindrobasidium torrendii FP15055 ss-10 TaxID=1314674 RepID=A0A0D7B146_9AGAR|nr:hypothetical protein CYLTODRAFT_457697 [Cylindrobasidium torrendii FP15055 ss-10]